MKPRNDDAGARPPGSSDPTSSTRTKASTPAAAAGQGGSEGAKKTPFVRVELFFLASGAMARVGPSATAVFVALLAHWRPHRRVVIPGLRRLARLTGLTSRAVQDAIARLEGERIIEKRARFDQTTGAQQSSEIALLPLTPPGWTPQEDFSRGGGNYFQGRGENIFRGPLEKSSYIRRSSSEEEERTTTPAGPPQDEKSDTTPTQQAGEDHTTQTKARRRNLPVEWARHLADTQGVPPLEAGLVTLWVRDVFQGDAAWFARCLHELALAGSFRDAATGNPVGTGYFAKALRRMRKDGEHQRGPDLLGAWSRGEPLPCAEAGPVATLPTERFLGRPNYDGREAWDGREYVPREEFIRRFPGVTIPLSPVEIEEQAAKTAAAPPPRPWIEVQP